MKLINSIEQFKLTMLNEGLSPPDIINPGELHRFPGIGKNADNKAGWCRLFEDLKGGVFGDFSSGLDSHWQAEGKENYSIEEQVTFRKRCEAERQQRDIEQQQRYETSIVNAKEIMKSATVDVSSHSYSIIKKVSLGERVKRGAWPQRNWKDALLVPLYDKTQRLCTIQAITTDGEKDFLKGGRKQGCFYPFGKISNADTVLIGEGLATVAAVYTSTNIPAAAAMDANNLCSVAFAVRELAPKAEIIILADNDINPNGSNIGVENATKAANKVSGRVVIPELNNEKCDFWDLWNKQGKTAVLKALENVKSLTPIYTPEKSEEKSKNQAAELVEFVKARTELFHDKNAAVYAQDLSTRETRRLDSRQFKDYLVSSFYCASEKLPREQAVREALGVLSGLARHEGKCYEVNVRVAMHQGAYYLDLAEPGKNRAICITDKGWEIIENHVIRFLRPETLLPLPVPEKGREIYDLWTLINIPENSRLLVLAWLIESLRPETPFPILELMGEQGSAKSTTQTILRQVIDPNTCDLRAAPKRVEDIFITAGVNWIVSYENVSYLSGDIQDAICIISTGGGFAKRKLYTDSDESVITVKRPVVLNGISAAITAQDLIDRTISVETPIINKRIEVNSLRKVFEEKHPYILGALLTLFSKCLATLSTIILPPNNRPRLTEFVHLGSAIAQALGEDEKLFLEEFNTSRQEAIARTIDASPVASAVIEWFEEEKAKMNYKITLPLKELFAVIEKRKKSYTDNWPRSVKGFGDSLRRAAPALRQLGIECRSLGKISGNIRWEISWIESHSESKS